MADMLELMKMPDKAKTLRDFKQEPDPVQQQIAQLEMEKLALENELTKAKIVSEYSGAKEDDADRAEKMAQAALKSGQARKVNSEADMLDMTFLKEDQGIAQREKLEVEDFKRKADLDKLAFQKLYGGPNEQLGV